MMESLMPIFKNQTRNPAEFTFIMCDQRDRKRTGVGCDQSITVADWFADCCEMSQNIAGSSIRFSRKYTKKEGTMPFLYPFDLFSQ